QSLTKENLHHIVELEVKEVSNRLREQNIKISLSQEALDLLIEQGFDPVFGARPLKRTIQKLLEDPLAEEIISGRYKDGTKINISRRDDVLIFESDINKVNV